MSVDASCRILETDEERHAAKEVVRRMYAAQGYDVESGSIAKYLRGPQAMTFGLFQGDMLYGTISIVIDSADGLPMDAIYTEELAAWRAEGKKLAEVVQFAMDHDAYAELTGTAPSPFAAAPLFSAILAHALEEHVEYLCISINPKHDRFYGMLGFKKIGDLKHYGSVNAPAIARAFYIPEWKKNPLIANLLGKDQVL